MSEVLKVHTGPSIQSNVTHVKGVKSSSICTVRAVMLFIDTFDMHRHYSPQLF